MSQKRARSASPPPVSTIFKSTPIEDRASRFIAVFSPTLLPKPLQDRLEFRDATHRIAGWRRPGAQRSLGSQPLLQTGHDDDGEKYGGKTLERVLNTRNVEGSIVVARWYGGVMLGPARFDHIKNCAEDAISQWEEAKEHAGKKAKLQTEANHRERLVQMLPQRDQSIVVLRGLLAEKTQSDSSSQGTSKGISSKTPDYSALDLSTLERLERVRDATIGWILDQIEKAEKTEKAQFMISSPDKLATTTLEIAGNSTSITANSEELWPFAGEDSVAQKI